MPYVSCPTCGERGKIPEGLVGVRIKCKQCGVSFQFGPPAAKAVGPAGTTPALAGAAAMASAGPSAAVAGRGGIEVEGLDASSWVVPAEAAITLKPGADPAAQAVETPSASAFVPATPASAGTREYKLLSARDKIFEGRFDLARLEEVLNQLGLQGWVAKSMLAPHLKGFSGVLEETIVVLLERSK
jgi:hypothetical protein